MKSSNINCTSLQGTESLNHIHKRQMFLLFSMLLMIWLHNFMLLKNLELLIVYQLKISSYQSRVSLQMRVD